jgi:hypothetical protein
MPGGAYLKMNNALREKISYNMFCIIIWYHQKEAMIQLLQNINKNSSIQHFIKVLLEGVVPNLVAFCQLATMTEPT